MPLLLARLLDNRFARDAAWRFIRRNWSALAPRISPQLAHRVVEATPALQGERHRREVRAFFTRHPLPAADRALEQVDERFRLDAQLRERAAPDLTRWLDMREGTRPPARLGKAQTGPTLRGVARFARSSSPKAQARGN
jgi:hypothetical protein